MVWRYSPGLPNWPVAPHDATATTCRYSVPVTEAGRAYVPVNW